MHASISLVSHAKMASYTLILLKKIAARPKETGVFSLQRGGRAPKNTKMKCGFFAQPDLRTTQILRNNIGAFIYCN